MYALFMWSRYYPSGGSGDLIDTFDSVDAAREYAKRCVPEDAYERYEIMDSSFCSVERGHANEL